MQKLINLSKVFFVLVLLANPLSLLAQPESERDSLESLLPFANDLQRADILNGLANCLRSIDTAKAGNYARQAYAISNQLNYCKGKATSEVIIGILYKNFNRLSEAKLYYLSGLALALKCKEPYSVSFAYHSLGNLAYMQGDLSKAMKYYIGSVKVSEQLRDYPRAARTYNNIGALYMDLKNIPKAEQYYLRSLELYKGSSDELIIAEIENNLANIYQQKGFELKALYHYTNALDVFRRKSSASDISSALNNIGLVYLTRKQPKKALPYLHESYYIDLKIHDEKSAMLVISNLITAYISLSKMDSAIYYSNEGLGLAKRHPNASETGDLYGAIADIFALKNDKEKESYYRSQKLKIDEGLISTEEKSEIGATTAEFEVERKEQKLKLMAKQNEINQLKIREQESEIERRNILLVGTFVVIFFLMLITGLVIFSFNLNKKTKLFEVSNRAKSNMLQQINHEIRTPLNGIVGMSDLALESKTFTELKEYLTNIKLSSDELMFVLNNLITYLQIDRKEAQPVATPFDLLDSFEELFRIYAFQSKQKGLLFNQMVYPGVPKKVSADKQKIMNMTQNLLSNAVKICQKGVVKVEVKQSASRVKDGKKLSTLQISVIDEGPGLTEKEIKQIFKENPTISNRGNGFGIGLKNVKDLCDLMKGHIEVISEKGVGSSFIFEIEVEDLDLTESAIGSDRNSNKYFEPAKYQILVVEDNLLNQKLFAKILEKEGFPFLIAENGLKALSMVKEKSFDLILMDIRMPEMDGIEATHHIRNREEFSMDRTIPIIAVTAHDDAVEKKKCFDVGMNDYLTKPINKDLFLKKIQEQLLAKV
ncbi:MAG: response regulator [Bacteroidia bacterium]|nr:response regulator [Bacteroidia bacterium]MCF8425743.1 response regulator [Bacteroidia bacterium]MCF8447753.1 response regulator [Bacteroidia bacterium]